MTASGTIRALSWIFGLLIGGMWIAEVLLGNLGGTPVFGNLRDLHPQLYAMAPLFALGAVVVTAVGGAVAAYRTGSIASALRVGVWSGVISGAIAALTGMSITVLFHHAMMMDPSNVHEFARGGLRPPSEAELSAFLYWDALGGGLNHLWIGPLLGLTIGGGGAGIGKLARYVTLHSPMPKPS
jgi:hypothetical protein